MHRNCRNDLCNCSQAFYEAMWRLAAANLDQRFSGMGRAQRLEFLMQYVPCLQPISKLELERLAIHE